MAIKDVLIKLIDPSDNSTVFTFGEAPWKIYGEIDGLNSISTSLTTTPIASGYGSLFNGAQLPSRTVSFKIVNVRQNNKEEDRKTLTSAIKPGSKKYFLEFTYMGKTKVLKNCYLTDYNIPSANVNGFIKGDFTFTALDPLFYAGEEQSLSFSGGSGTIKLNCDAPVLPCIIITGASSGSRVTFYSDDDNIKYYIEVLGSPKGPIPNTLTLDIPKLVNQEVYRDDNLAFFSFSTDISKLMLSNGDHIILSGVNSITLKFYGRDFGL